VRLGLADEGEGGRLGLVLVVIFPVTTHPLQCQGFELDMQETSATEVCVLVQLLSLEKGVSLGLVVEGEGGRLGLVLVMICQQIHIPFSTGVSS
jgi:hypothetical protein